MHSSIIYCKFLFDVFLAHALTRVQAVAEGLPNHLQRLWREEKTPRQAIRRVPLAESAHVFTAALGARQVDSHLQHRQAERGGRGELDAARLAEC